MNTSDERGRFLEFEQTHWQIQTFIVQLEDLAKILNKKQGDLRETEALAFQFRVISMWKDRVKNFFFHFFKKKIHEEKLLNTIESLLPELTRRAQNYNQLSKKGQTIDERMNESQSFFLSSLDDHVGKEFLAYCEQVRKLLKSISTDLKSKEHLISETLNNWNIYENLFDQLEKWFNDGRRVLLRSADEQLVNHFVIDSRH